MLVCLASNARDRHLLFFNNNYATRDFSAQFITYLIFTIIYS